MFTKAVFRLSVLCLTLGVASGCSEPAPSPEPTVHAEASPALSVMVTVDGAELGPLQLSSEDGRWDLLTRLPTGSPPVADWYSIDLHNEAGTWSRMRQPAERLKRERLELVVEDGAARVEQRLIVGAQASEAARLRASKPLRTVLDLSRVAVYTAPVEHEAPPPRQLRTTLNGAGSGHFQPEELARTPRQTDPCRMNQDGGYEVVDLVALRHELAGVRSVTLTALGGESVSLTGAQLRAPSAGGVLRLKPNKQQEWSFKAIGPTPDCELVSVLRNVERMAIETTGD